MAGTVRKHSCFFQLLHDTSSKQRKALLQTITDDQLKSLCEVILNVYRGTLPLSTHYIKKLIPYKTFILSLTDRRVGSTYRKKKLVQINDVIPWLVKPLLSQLKHGKRTDLSAKRKVRNVDDVTTERNSDDVSSIIDEQSSGV